MKKTFAILRILFAQCALLACAKAYAASCLSCHPMKGWEESQHAKIFGTRGDRACLICHKNHPIPFPKDSGPFAFLRGAEIGGVTAVHTLCQQCHVSHSRHPRIPAPDIQDQFEKVNLGGSAMPLIFTGHKPFVGEHPEESVLLGSKQDELPHTECTDCHDPHRCNLTEPLRGAKGISMQSRPVGYGTDNPRTPHDYEVCFRCHGDSYRDIQPFPSPPYRLRPPSNTNKRAEFDPATHMNLQPELRNISFHPVVYPGNNQSQALEDQLVKATNGQLHATSTIRCIDCHNNDAFSEVRGRVRINIGSYGEPEGPHGSLYKSILRAYYSTDVGDDTHPPFDRYNPKNFALCFNCHDEKAFDGDPYNKETNFYSKQFGNLHYLHLADKRIHAYESCMECHYNVHSNVTEDTTLFILSTRDKETRLLWFYPGVKGSGKNSFPEWIKEEDKRTCAMVCHSHLMNYSYGDRFK